MCYCSGREYFAVATLWKRAGIHSRSLWIRGRRKFLGFMVPVSWLSMMGDSDPFLPSYLQSEWYRSQPGRPLCPGQLLKAMSRIL